jgi:maltose alpha-D-glucosyltransferase/alpha-amylase
MRSLWNNGHGTVSDHWTQTDCFFEAEGGGTAGTFTAAWESTNAVVEGYGFVVLPTANHDFSRLVCGPRTREQARCAFAFQLTWPTLPAVYYGDEIGMRYVPGLPDHEGSVLGERYNRAGSRTPMQWDDSPNAGFSTAPADRLYLPVDPDPDRPTVAAQRADEGSLLHLVRRLIALRKATPELGAHSPVDVLHTGYPFVYVRGGRFLVVVNPRRETAELRLPRPGLGDGRPVLNEGVRLGEGLVTAPGFSWGVFELAD